MRPIGCVIGLNSRLKNLGLISSIFDIEKQIPLSVLSDNIDEDHSLPLLLSDLFVGGV